MNVLKSGTSGVDVIVLQQLLNEAPTTVPKIQLDGQFGPSTTEAVKTFQRAKGLTPDGVLGPVTWKALRPDVLHIPPAPGGTPPWMLFAYAEKALGIHRNTDHHNRQIIEYLHTTTNIGAQYQNTDSTAWCSAFVNWCMIRAGRRGTNNASARSWLGWGQAMAQPRLGAVAVIHKHAGGADGFTGSSSGNHVAFVVYATSASVYLLGGNQGSAVKESTFMVADPKADGNAGWDLLGYRWPA